MAKLLITGANGYIGKHVVNYMKSADVDFIATDFNVKGSNLKDNLIECDLFNCEDLYERAGCPNTLLHLAWRNGFIHNDLCHLLDLSNHFKFLTNMINSGVKHICVLGSMHEVGYHEGAIDENTPTRPMSQYAIAKNTLRQSLELFCNEKGVILQWIRAFYIYGDDIDGNSIFSKLQAANIKGENIFPFTSGKNKYDFLSVFDLAKQITAVVNQTEICGIINCCSGKPVSLADQVENYIVENNLNVSLKYGAFPDRIYDSPGIWGDDKKINIVISNMEKKMISVVIPMYNAEKSIIDSLNSIKKQTLLEEIKEIIIVNDGSTDNSESIVNSYILENPFLPIILINKENGGVSSARNCGMKLAVSNWIALLDSDDEWLENKIEEQIKIINKHPYIRFLGTNRNDEHHKFGKKVDIELYKLNIMNLLYKVWPHTSTVLMHKEILETVGLYDESRTHCEDAQYLMKIAAKYDIYYISKSLEIAGKGKPTYGYSGLSSNLKEMHKGCIKNINEAYDLKYISLFFKFFFLLLEQLKYIRRKIKSRKF